MDKEEARRKVSDLVEKWKQYESEGKLRNMNEDDTKDIFIMPLFEALGWNIRNVDEVKRQENVPKGRADYAFKISSVTRFFVEAKEAEARLGEEEAKQASDYAYNMSVQFAVLTNFKQLIVYDVERENLNDRIFLTFDHTEYEDAERFKQLWLLSNESVANGELDRVAAQFGHGKKRDPLTKALFADFREWRRMLSKNILKHSRMNKLTSEQVEEGVQRLLNRFVFIRTCEERRLENERLRAAVREWKIEGKRRLMRYFGDIFDDFNDIYDSDIFTPHLAGELYIDNDIMEQVVDGLYKYRFGDINADILGNVYEQYLATIMREGGGLREKGSVRKEMGIYYTPTYIVDYIVKNTLGELISKAKDASALDKIKVLDPACGSGSFLIRSYEILNEAYKKKNGGDNQMLSENISLNAHTILTKNIHGVDLDPKAVEIAELNLLLRAAYQRGRLPLLSPNIKCGNSLISGPPEELEKYFGKSWREKRPFNWEEKFPDVMKEGGFDVVVGNPPYLLLQPQNTPEELLQYIKDKFSIAQYKIDDFHLFIERGISLLRQGGCLGFITPNTYLMNTYTTKLRKYILDNCKILKIVIIPQAVFPDASVDASIIVLQKEKNESSRRKNKIDILEVGDFNEPPRKISLINQDVFFTSPNNLFTIRSSANSGIAEKLKSKSVPLGELCRISFGLQTKDRKTYVKDSQPNNRWKPCIDGGDITRYSLKFNRQYLFHDLKIKAGGCWDESTHNVPEKIVIRQIGHVPIAALDTKRYYSLNTIYNLTSLQSGFNYRYILALINSKLAGFYWKANFSDSKLLFPKVKKAYLDQLPIHLAQESEQQPIIKLVDRMLELNNRLVELGEKQSSERYELEEERKRTDEQIDGLVYKLYGITEEERKIIEKSFS